MIKNRKQNLIDDLSLLDPDQIYEYLIDNGIRFTEKPSWASDLNKVPGCISDLWLEGKIENNKLKFDVCSNSRLVDGTARIMISLVDDCDPKDLIEELDELDSMPSILGLSSQRRNGTSHLISKIKGIIKSCQ